MSSTAGQTPTHSEGMVILSPRVRMTSSMSISGETRRSSGALSRKGPDVDHRAARGLVGQVFLLDGHFLLARAAPCPRRPWRSWLSFMPFSMPLMMAAMPTRLATPRMMPSMVSSERNLCDQTSFRPTMMVFTRFMAYS